MSSEAYLRSPVLAVLSADWQLQWQTWSDHPTLCGDAVASLSQLVRLARQHACPLVGAGDLLDRTLNRSGLIFRLSELLHELDSTPGCRLLFVQGNHDAAPGQEPWPLAVSRRAVHLECEDFELADGWRVSGLDYRTASAELLSLLEVRVRRSQPQLMVLHQTLRELFPFGTKLSFADFPAGPLVYCCGDVHVMTEGLIPLKAGGHARLVSPGSICLQNLDEQPRKGAYLLFRDGTVRPHYLQTRPFYVLRCFTPEDLPEERSRLERWLDQQAAESACLDPLIRRPMVVVKYVPEALADVLPQLKQSYAERVHLFLRPIRSKDPFLAGSDRALWDHLTGQALHPVGAALREHCTEVSGGKPRDWSLPGLIASILTGPDQSQVCQDLLRLLGASDTWHELQRMEQETLDEEIDDRISEGI